MRLLHWQPPWFIHSPRSSWKGDVDVEFPAPSVCLRRSTVTLSRSSSCSWARVWNTARCETEWCEEGNPAGSQRRGASREEQCGCARVCVYKPPPFLTPPLALPHSPTHTHWTARTLCGVKTYSTKHLVQKPFGSECSTRQFNFSSCIAKYN